VVPTKISACRTVEGIGSGFISVTLVEGQELSTDRDRKDKNAVIPTKCGNYFRRLHADGSGEDYITRNFMLCTPRPIPFGCSSKED
jgi:hypothetical protein